MTDRRRAVLALGFFIFWLAVLYAGADHPPPPGFLLLVLFDLLAAAGVYWRLPTYAAWAQTQRPHRLQRVLADGTFAGLALALLTLLLPLGGEPTAPPPAWPEHAIWFIVLAGVGGANTLILYALCALSHH